jgi:hypothetical protein
MAIIFINIWPTIIVSVAIAAIELGCTEYAIQPNIRSEYCLIVFSLVRPNKFLVGRNTQLNILAKIFAFIWLKVINI